MTRATAANEKNAMIRIVMVRLAVIEVIWKVVASTMATSRYGRASIMSMSRASRVSRAPPANPASVPTAVPAAEAIRAARTPTAREIRAP